MPQMNPIWWLSLMMFFLTILMLTNTWIFFIKNYNFFIQKNEKKMMNIPSNNWKW